MYIKNNYLNTAPLMLANPYELDSTNDALYKNNILEAKAELEGHESTAGLRGIGMLAQQVGGNLMNMGMQAQAKKLASKVGQDGFTQQNYNSAMNKMNTVNNGFNILQSLPSIVGMFAMGGQPQDMMMANMEGGEAIETPDGNMMEVQGPSHEQGGVTQEVPKLAQIYSDRIKIKGLSIADRNKKRTKRNASLQDIMNRNPYDTMLEKSWEQNRRQDLKLKEEEQKLQQYIQQLIGR